MKNRPGTIDKKCLNCKKYIVVFLNKHLQGKGKFCSLPCFFEYRKKNKKEKDHNTICSFCNKSFYRNEYRKSKSKSGLHFCCREHKDNAQKVHGGVEGFYSNFKDGNRISYRDVAFEYHQEECNRCGYKKHKEILEVHHIDRNRNNNAPSNLEVICPNCHMEDHFLSKDGKWSKRN